MVEVHDQGRAVVPGSHLSSARSQRHGLTVQRVERAHTLHQRLAHRVGAQRARDEVGGAGVDEWSVVAGEPSPHERLAASIPVEVEGHYDSATIQVVGQVIAQCYLVRVAAIAERYDYV